MVGGSEGREGGVSGADNVDVWRSDMPTLRRLWRDMLTDHIQPGSSPSSPTVWDEIRGNRSPTEGKTEGNTEGKTEGKEADLQRSSSAAAAAEQDTKALLVLSAALSHSGGLDAAMVQTEHLYNIQCSEIFTLRNEKLHTET